MDINMHHLIAELQCSNDDLLISQIQKQTNRIDRYSDHLKQLNEMHIQLQTLRKDSYDSPVDLSQIEEKIHAFKEWWKELREDYAKLDDCPFENLDLQNVQPEQFDEVTRNLDAIRTRLQNKYPTLMLEVEKITHLFKLTTDIMAQIMKFETESRKSIVRNQITR